MAENSSNKENLTELASLYSIRADMHDFCQNEDNEFARIGVLSAYDKLLEDDELRDKINSGIEEYILRRLNVGNFDYQQIKTSATEDRKRNQRVVLNNTQNSIVSKIIKQLREEISFMARPESKRQEEFKGLENAELLSVNVNEHGFWVQVAGRKEPLRLGVFCRNGKYFSHCGQRKIADKKFPMSGLNNSSYELIAAKGIEGFILQKVTQSDDLGKKYSPSEYCKLWGLKSVSELSTHQKKGLEYLNSLSSKNQKSFIIALRQYLLRKKKFVEIINFVKDTDDKISLLSEPEKLREKLNNIGVEDFLGNMQKQFVHHVQKNKGIWNNFSNKNEESQQRFSRYEILQNNLIGFNTTLFSNLYENNDADIKQKIKTAFTKIHHMTEPALPEGLCAEIMALGIFKEGTKEPLSTQKLEKMNTLLNEFGLNIAFKSLPVVKAPAADIINARQQSKLDRENFEEFKLTEDYINEEKRFYATRKLCGAEKVDDVSTHHYIALRYNGFVEADLNNNANLVKTARKNPWNYDGHSTTHLFDMAEEFLVKNDSGAFSLTDFTRLRKRFNAGEKFEIQAPVLQVKNDEGKFVDLLALGEKEESGHYISDDKTASVINVPDYCREGLSFGLLRVIKASKTEKKASEII